MISFLYKGKEFEEKKYYNNYKNNLIFKDIKFNYEYNFFIDFIENNKYAINLVNKFNYSNIEACKIQNKLYKLSEKYNIPINELFTIINTESDFRIYAYNEKGKAYGLCQITQPCLNEYNFINRTDYKLEELFDMELNLEIGVWYYNRLLNIYSNKYGINNLRDCYIAYNIGAGIFKKVGENGRNKLREGVCPINMHGLKAGDNYYPIKRYDKINKFWS